MTTPTTPVACRRGRLPAAIAAVAVSALLTGGCASVGVGLSLPFPGGSIGVGADSGGRVGGGVTVGGRHGGVTIGGSGRWPDDERPARPAPAPASR